MQITVFNVSLHLLHLVHYSSCLPFCFYQVSLFALSSFSHLVQLLLAIFLCHDQFHVAFSRIGVSHRQFTKSEVMTPRNLWLPFSQQNPFKDLLRPEEKILFLYIVSPVLRQSFVFFWGKYTILPERSVIAFAFRSFCGCCCCSYIVKLHRTRC